MLCSVLEKREVMYWVVVGYLVPPESEAHRSGQSDRGRVTGKRHKGGHVVSAAVKLAEWRRWEEGRWED